MKITKEKLKLRKTSNANEKQLLITNQPNAQALPE